MKTSLKTSLKPTRSPKAALRSLMGLKTYGLWRPAAAALALLLGACASAPSVSEIQDDIPEQATQAMRAGIQRSRSVASGETATTINGLAGADAPTLSSRFPADQLANEALDRVRTYLRERVFTEAHFEKAEGSTAIFLLTPAVCTDGQLPVSPSCRAFFEETEVRLGVSRDSAGYSIDLMLGVSQATPLTFEVAEGLLAVRSHLGAFHEAARELGPEGTELAASFPEILEGDVRIALSHSADNILGFAIDIQDVTIETAPGTPGNVALSTGTSSLLAVALNTATNGVEIKYALPKTRLELPYSQIAPEGIAGTRFSVNLEGLSATLAGADGQPITLRDLSLGGGKAEVKLDAFTLFSADLNETLGGRASVIAERRADGVTDLTVDPGFDLLLAFALAPIADDVVVPDALLDAVYRLAFTAEQGMPLLRAFGPNWGTGASGYAEIINGTLSFEHVGNGSIVASVGQCVSSATPAEGEDPILASFDVVDCQQP